MAESTPVIEVQNVSKYFGSVVALENISMDLYPGEVMGLLGDNGAGKSTLIKIFSGVHKPSEGKMLVDGEEIELQSPREALDMGIATVHQDLGMLPLMDVSRNFFLGREPERGWGPFRRMDIGKADKVAREQLEKIGIELRDTRQPVGTLSGGERQSVAIARAIYFGAKVLILDEPTSALGVKEAATVLRYVTEARKQGLGTIFITHNVYHAFPVSDRFTILDRGSSYGTFMKNEVSRMDLERMMAGGEEIDRLSEELEQASEELSSEDSELAAQYSEEAEELQGESDQTS